MDLLNLSEHSKIFLSNNVDFSNSASNSEGGCHQLHGYLRATRKGVPSVGKHQLWGRQRSGFAGF